MPRLASLTSQQLRGIGFQSELFPFTSFTFTSGGVTGYNGPALNTLLTAYNTSTYPWLANTSYFDVNTQGIQEWTVPKDGTYRITAAGAQGGYNSYYSTCGGFGAVIKLDVVLTKGTTLNIVVGQAGIYGGVASEGAGGGGGSFIYTGSIAGTGLILAAAGGGGADDTTNVYTQEHGVACGGSSARSDFAPTLYNNYTTPTYTNNGLDGASNGGTVSYGPGAGWLNDVYNRIGDTTYKTAGKSVSSPNWQGGTSPSYAGGSYGGFGGGGANYDDGGAGGGFTGGSTTSSTGGGAGGSFYAGMINAHYTSIWGSAASNYSWVGWRGHSSGTSSLPGYVTIQKL